MRLMTLYFLTQTIESTISSSINKDKILEGGNYVIDLD